MFCQAFVDFIGPIRLAQKIIHSGLEHFLALFYKSRSCNRNNLYRLTVGQLTNSYSCFYPIHDRHTSVHPDKMRMPALEQLHALLAVICNLDINAYGFHQLSEQQLVFQLILDNQHAVARLPGCEAHHLPWARLFRLGAGFFLGLVQR